MNSTVSDLDALTSDDITGAQALYPQGVPIVTVPPEAQAARVGGITLSDNGAVLLALSGPPGKDLTIYASLDLLNWLPVVSLSNPQGTLEYRDTTAGRFRWRFYKAVAK